MTLDAASRQARYAEAFAGLDAPFAFVDLDAMDHNARDLLRRAHPKPIRVASKSVRCRAILDGVLARDDGFRGVLAFTLPEALWLDGHGVKDIVVAYPSTDRGALRALAARTAEAPDTAPVIMVDSVEHLDFVNRVVGDSAAPLRVCLDFDASFRLLGGRVAIGAKRTPVHRPADARRLAEMIAARRGVRLVGLMSYEGHIAGYGDRVAGARVKNFAVRELQRRSYAELSERRAAAVAAVREVAELEFVNAGGTGDLELVATEPAITEATAGSGLYAPHLFDTYSAFTLQPAAMFALPVSRRPGPGVVTVLGGGYLASGAAGKDRLPRPFLPTGLRLDAAEGAGEVQTPLHGAAADALHVGDNVYFRHAKAGELCERFDRLHLVRGSEIADVVPTYRGEGQTFL